MSTRKRNTTPEELKQLRTAFVHAFPNCFAPKGGTKRPLKIGIFKDLSKRGRETFPGVTVRMLRAFIHDYCSGYNYFASMRTGCVRVDLDGNFSGMVTEHEAEYAAAQMKRIKQKKSVQRRTYVGIDPAGGVAIAEVVDGVIASVFTRTPLEIAEADVARLEQADYAAEMSDNWYHSSGRHAQMQAQIRAAKDKVEELKNA